jgi:hypothetical protein
MATKLHASTVTCHRRNSNSDIGFVLNYSDKKMEGFLIDNKVIGQHHRR